MKHLAFVLCLTAGLADADEHVYPRVVSEDRPVGYWRFEEPDKVANLGSQEAMLDGTYMDVEITPESATAALGNAAVLDRPTSRIQLAAPVSRWLNETSSLEFWIKTQQAGEGSWNAPALFGADSNGNGNDLFWGTNYQGQVGVRRGDSGPAALTPKPINDNHWHHVVLTRDHDSGLMQAFLDGRLVSTYQDASNLPIKTIYGTIGQSESLPGQAQKLMAAIDEVAVYDYVLSPKQVNRHWNAASPR